VNRAYLISHFLTSFSIKRIVQKRFGEIKKKVVCSFSKSIYSCIAF